MFSSFVPPVHKEGLDQRLNLLNYTDGGSNCLESQTVLRPQTRSPRPQRALLDGHRVPPSEGKAVCSLSPGQSAQLVSSWCECGHRRCLALPWADEVTQETPLLADARVQGKAGTWGSAGKRKHTSRVHSVKTNSVIAPNP